MVTSIGTITNESIIDVIANATIETRDCSAIVDIFTTGLARPTRQTITILCCDTDFLYSFILVNTLLVITYFDLIDYR
jgi:hypothetical protein